jgi:hypothetical protein
VRQISANFCEARTQGTPQCRLLRAQFSSPGILIEATKRQPPASITRLERSKKSPGARGAARRPTTTHLPTEQSTNFEPILDLKVAKRAVSCYRVGWMPSALAMVAIWAR